jgi:hypothetical protein
MKKAMDQSARIVSMAARPVKCITPANRPARHGDRGSLPIIRHGGYHSVIFLAPFVPPLKADSALRCSVKEPQLIAVPPND